MVNEEEDVADVDGGSGAAEERGIDLAEPDGCVIGMTPWTDISRYDCCGRTIVIKWALCLATILHPRE